jgi:PAS domain S-box-containing protein
VSTTSEIGAASRVMLLGKGAGGRAAADRAPVIVNGYQDARAGVPEFVAAGVQAAVAAPLLHEGRLLGVVEIVSDESGRHFTSDDVDTLVMLAGLAAPSLVEWERKRTQRRLRLQTERLEQLAESTSDAIIVTDRTMRVLAWNRGAEQMYGWTRQEVLGRELPTIPPDRRTEANRLWRRVLENGETVANYEETRVTSEGRSLSIMATISPLRDEHGAIIGVIGIAKDRTAIKAAEEQERVLARLEERESIAMDLHDNVVQALHGVVFSLAAAERAAEPDVAQLLNTVEQARKQLNRTIGELRSYVHLMRRYGAPRRALSAGLIALADQARILARFRTNVDIDEQVERLVVADRSLEHLYAIACEAIFNAIRHSRGDVLEISLCHKADALVLVIADNGCGFEVRGAEGRPGQGLMNMTDRARLIGADLSLKSTPGVGTRVRVELPTSPPPPAD